MASSYTENYGLCQWEPGDNFVRTEFNQDNQKIDAALAAAEETAAAATAQAAAALEARCRSRTALLGRDLYNLLLQAHYEGKTTGWKRALFFDGFQDKTQVASASGSLFFMDRVVGLCSTVQGDINMGYATQAQEQSTSRVTGTYTSQGYAVLTGLTVKTRTDSGDSIRSGTYRVYVNDEEVRSGSMELNFDDDPLENTITFSAVPLRPGDQFYMRTHVGSPTYLFYGPASGGGDLGGKLHLTPTAGESGTITTRSLALPDRTGLRAWVRFSGGSVSLSAQAAGGNPAPFTSLGDRVTVNAAGEACIEREFALDAPPGTGNLTFTVSLDLEGSAQMLLYDYGILLL